MSAWRRYLAQAREEYADANSANSAKIGVDCPTLGHFGTNGAIGTEAEPPALPVGKPVEAEVGPEFLPGVPEEWRLGVMRLKAVATPSTIAPERWAAYVQTCERVLRQHGAALDRLGWSTLDIFGLHRTHPGTNPPGWGVAWLIGEVGEVVEVAADRIVIQSEPGRVVMTFRKSGPRSPEVLAAWGLDLRSQTARAA